jgi:protein TonB
MIFKGKRIFYLALAFSAALHLLLFLSMPRLPVRSLPVQAAGERPAVSLYLAAVPAGPKPAAARPKGAVRPLKAAPVPEAASLPAEPEPDLALSAQLMEESPASQEPAALSPEASPAANAVSAPERAAGQTAIAFGEAVQVASAPAPQAVPSATETAGYRELLEALRAKIVDNIRYPPQARSRGWKGTVLLLASLDAQGRLRELTVRKSSGHSVLDQAAAALVRRVTPISNTLGRPLSIEIPIVYELKER